MPWTLHLHLLWLFFHLPTHECPTLLVLKVEKSSSSLSPDGPQLPISMRLELKCACAIKQWAQKRRPALPVLHTLGKTSPKKETSPNNLSITKTLSVPLSCKRALYNVAFRKCGVLHTPRQNSPCLSKKKERNFGPHPSAFGLPPSGPPPLRAPTPPPSTFCTKYLVAPSEGLPASFSHFLRSRMFFPAPLSERSWGRHLLGGASGTPCASVLYELALPDSLCLSNGRALALFGRLHSLTAGVRSSPAAVLALSHNTPGTWAHWCLSLLQHHAAGNPADFGRAAPQRSPADGYIALSIPCWIERGFIVSVAASP